MDYKYHCYIPAAPGLNTLPFNPCSLLDLQLLTLSPGETWTGTSGDREILAVILGGAANFTVGGSKFAAVGGRADVFSGKPHSVYIPAGSDITIEAVGAVEIALPSAPSDLVTEPYVIEPSEVASGRWGGANFGRNYHQILTEIAQPSLPARRLIVGETYTPSGNWSTYPPHRHSNDNLPAEAAHEEMYYFRVAPEGGFGICRLYTDEGYEENFTVRDHGVHMMPEGYHTVVSAPGYTTYYLWFLAGTQRTQGAHEDTTLSWVGRTVPTLRDLGL
ncbi:5-deoxy-glucuronate isomerase [Actinoplanes philippinensis]|uniref:5-deoxy-glucuronate isomerase n=1 Tax=Actinoplanes philippinensis TaxID=35752 RepID=A0A1I2LVG4_9ACTN|nr:5-deoxy-glucuronate isomerase [Actinoplanes philippinensis]GIE82272.1 5-deoxy-glucuronate isomerase [Actinoplanes philippinensis]SFF82450.1 5-deoxy-glucuronate isomerase [Actinoplanes philippinensis]